MCSQDVPNNTSFCYPIWFAHGSISMYRSCKKGRSWAGRYIGPKESITEHDYILGT